MATVGFPPPAAKLCAPWPFSSHRALRAAKNLTPHVRCSAKAAPGTAAEENTASTSSAPPAPKPFTSLISSSNVEKALRGIAITNADHYGRLGIARGASYDEDRPSTKVHSAPGGGSSLGYLFGGPGN